MLSVKLKSFIRNCGPTTGGISRIYLFDRDDFDFTQAAASADGDMPGYTAVARRDGADDGLMYIQKFEKNEAEYKYTKTKKGASVKYDHEVGFLLADLGQLITQWNQKVDAAGACNGLGLIVEFNSGKVIVLGEKYVNGQIIPGEWIIADDGGSGTTGKLRDDANGHTAALKGDYSRPAYEFVGGISAIDALTVAAP